MTATTIEQSKVLIELGIDVKTADMHWFTSIFHNQDLLHINAGFEIKAYNLFLADENLEYIPSWSYNAMLDLMPDDVIVEKKGKKLTWRGQVVECGDAIVAAFNMLVWLMKNNEVHV